MFNLSKLNKSCTLPNILLYINKKVCSVVHVYIVNILKKG